jgi:hypothetical protein
MKRSNRRRRFALAALLALIVAASAYAFTASNTVPSSAAGEGSGTITGFTASAIHYTLDTANPANITGVSFTLAPAPTATATVRAALNAGAYVNCTGPVSGTWSCPVTGTVLAATSLKVVAAD